MEPVRTHRRPSRRLGQNFLIDQQCASSIVSAADLGQNDVVLEPGAGYGTLTRLLETRAGRVIAVEKDRYLASHLRGTFKNSPSVQIVEGDVLKSVLPSFNKIVGTPPYYLSSRLVLFLARSRFEKAFLVFQREFGERLVAPAGTRNYGRLSVTAQRVFSVKPLTMIPRNAFDPVPKVDSVLLSITPKPVREDIDRQLFDEVVRGIFTQRRRLVRGALLHYLELRFGRPKAIGIVSSISLPNMRVYQLSVSRLETICQELSSALRKVVPEPN